ncbi:putative Histidine kinase [Candidatus Sulfopaludibacter sp. SbA4]|nr:putative Histidine kinase [Candidatus Sulfopaludibacter sp. SbA4]
MSIELQWVGLEDLLSVEQQQLDWLESLSAADDFASAGEAALAGFRRVFGAEEATIRLEGERWNDAHFQYPRDVPVAPSIQAALQTAAERQRPVCEACEGRCAWAMPFREGVIGLLLPTHPGNDIAEQASLLVRQLLGRLEEIQLAEGMAEIDRAINREIELDQFLDNLFDQVVDGLGFHFAAIALVNERRNEIRMARTRNVALGWRIGSRYALSLRDILADVVRTGKTEIVAGFDQRFNPKTFQKYGHANMIRIWTPIQAAGKVIGVLEAGCPVVERHTIMTQENARAVELLARDSAPVIHRLAASGFFLDAGVKNLRRSLNACAVAAGVWTGAGLVLDAADHAEGGFNGAPYLETCRNAMLSRGDGAELEVGPQWIAEHTPVAGQAGISKVILFPLRLQGDTTGLIAAFLERDATIGNSFHARSFARRMEPCVAGQLVRDNLRQSLERAQNLTNLHGLIHSSATTGKLESTLQVIGQRALFLVEADSVCIYEYFGAESSFGVLRMRQGEFDHAALLENPVYPRSIVDSVLRGRDRHYATSAQKEPALTARDGGVPRFVEREQIQSCAILLLHTGNPSEPVGLMFLNYKTSRSFPLSIRKEIEALARSAAFAISSARYAEQQSAALTRRYAELEMLRHLDQEILRQIQELDMGSIYDLVLECLSSLTNLSVCSIMTLNEDRRTLSFRAHRGYDEFVHLTQDVNEGFVGEAIREQRSILISDIGDRQPVYKEWVKGMRSELVVPIIDRNAAVGAINLEHYKPGAFSGQDARFAELLASRLVFALHTADLYQQLTDQIQPRRALGLIATRTQDAKYDLDGILRLLLTGVTAREGLGFSRAMLLLIERDVGRLKGRLGIGAVTLEEARENWESLRQPIPSDFEERLRALLEAVDRFSTSVKGGVARESLLTERIQEIDWPLETIEGALRAAVHSTSGGVIQVEAAAADWFRQQLADLTGTPADEYAFVVVPLLAHGKVLGIIVVDDRFIPLKERRLAPQEELRTLEAFAELAAMSIENAELRERLQTESHEELTHQIKTPITLARARLRVLEEALPKERHHERYLLASVGALMEKARRIATSVRLFASLSLGPDLRGNFRGVTCEVLEDWITAVIRDYELILDDTPLSPRLEFYSLVRRGDLDRKIMADQLLIDQVVFNLLDNALKYSHKTSKVHVEWEVSQDHFVLRIENPSMHVPDDEIRTCRERGARGRVARSISPGSGLGLWIVDHVIAAHRGVLFVESPGDTFRVTVRLPLLREGRHE